MQLRGASRAAAFFEGDRNPPMAAQWNNLLQHLGVWEGSFTRLNPRGEITADTPTTVELAGLDENRRIRQTIARFPADAPPPAPQVLEYGTLSRGMLLFENGAFSLGSMQFSPFATFGAEFGFIAADRRLRLVTLFDRESQLSELTLIREGAKGSDALERLPLEVEQLCGQWQGAATAIYPDYRPPQTYSTQLEVRHSGDRLQQKLQAPGLELTSEARIDGQRLYFESGPLAYQVLLLPAGASCNVPPKILNRQPFFLEVGWLLARDRRLRLLRNYDASGAWTNLTLIDERKVG
ncbi:MAG: DUF3598 family protein [Cyanobacteria bacterium J06641_5]